MTKIETRIAEAIRNREDLKYKPQIIGCCGARKYHDEVKADTEGVRLYLFGYEVAKYSTRDNTYYIDTCGYDTRTTRSRLNVFASAFNLGIQFHIRGGRMVCIGDVPENVTLHFIKSIKNA